MERLIEKFVPERYEVVLDIDKKARRVEGRVTVSGVAKGTEICLHAKELEVGRVTVDGREVEWEIEGDKLTLVGEFSGEVEVKIEYGFELTETMHGAYLSRYEYEGKTEWVVATQFESHYARECFPCVDEPEAKAVFDLVLVTDAGETVLGGTLAKEEITEGERLRTVFERTPRMSTYLLAFVVGRLQGVEGRTKRGVLVRSYCSMAQEVGSLEYANDVAIRLMDFFEEYFGVDYPLAKLDQVALPDFEAGAMENWGLMTYRESLLLVDPKVTSVSSKQYVLLVIAHELSHQWFGNLVTMKWWDDLWLNEGFASVMEYVAADAVEPENKLWENFFTGDVVAALRRDALSGVQAVRQEVGHPHEIQSLFDGAIVYAKGARLIYMLMKYMGEEKFREGVRRYLSEFAYENTTGSDLWKVMSEVAGFDVGALMEGWVGTPGYPVVSVWRDGDGVELSQKRFLVDGEMGGGELWKVPLFGRGGVPELLEERSVRVPTSGVVEVNQGMGAHFVSNYDDGLRAELLSGADEELKRKILTDQALLVKTDLAKSESLFEILETLREEESEALWSTAAVALSDLRWFVDVETEEAEAMKKFVGELVDVQYRRLGWEKGAGDTDKMIRLRSMMVDWKIYSGDEAVVERALAEFEKAGDLMELDGDLRDGILTAKVRYGFSVELVDELLKIYATTASVALKDDICSALCATSDRATIGRLLDVMRDEGVVRRQDVLRWYVYLARNGYGRDLAWKYLRGNWGWFKEVFGEDKGYDDYPRYAAAALKTEGQLGEYREFFGPMVDEVALRRNIEMGVAELEARVKLIAADGPEVRGWLMGGYGG